VPIAIHHQAVEAGRTRDKGCIADVGNALPVSSQVKRRSLFLCIKPLFDRMLQAVLRAFALALARRSVTGDDAGALMKERFDSFLTEMCDAIVGCDARRGREAKHIRRFLRMVMRHLHTSVGVQVDVEDETAIGVSAACEATANLHATFEGENLSQDVGDHQSAADAHVNIEMSLKDVARGKRALGNNVDAAAVQASCAQENELAQCHEGVLESEALYLGVALEEQCVCEWSGLRIPAVLCGMLSALSTPVDVMLEALSGVAAVDDGAAAMVFAELESLCVGHAKDAEAVCGAIVSKRSVHGAGLDIGLLRLWLRRLPDSVSFESVL
jgi:hypothetical protein